MLALLEIVLGLMLEVSPKPLPGIAPAGIDFAAEVQALAREVGCAGLVGPGDRASDAVIDAAATDRAAVVARHCRQLAHMIDVHRARWRDAAQTFFKGIVPADVPSTVVYPFGGADLMTALVVFPDARDITVLGLEQGGDVRTLARLSPAALEVDLEVFRKALEHIFDWTWSRTIDLDRARNQPLPNELALDVTGLVMLGFEPVGLRYFTLASDGTPRWSSLRALLEADRAAAELAGAKRSRALASAFASFELTFREAGRPDAPLRTFRHISANLDDDHLSNDPRPLRFLDRLPPSATITKAASYLLWWNNFSTMRDWVVGHLRWMVSDSTGVPPDRLPADAFEQTTYGRFEGSFIGSSKASSAALAALFATQPPRALPMMFGYPDVGGNAHLVVTRALALQPAGDTLTR